MLYQESTPSISLADYVKCYWSIEYRCPGPAEPEPIVPDGCIEIVFDLADKFRQYDADGRYKIQPEVLVAGQMRTSVLVGPTGNVSLFGIRFKPTGAVRFFDLEVNELSDRITPLELIWGNGISLVAEQLAEADTFAEKVAIVESWLLSKMIKNSIYAPEVELAISLISAGNGMTPIPQIAREAGISERGLVRKFRQIIGLSPKAYSRIIRFQRVLRSIEQNAAADIIDTAIRFGYYDQSHLISDFRQYSGLTPGEYIEGNNRITEAFISGE